MSFILVRFNPDDILLYLVDMQENMKTFGIKKVSSKEVSVTPKEHLSFIDTVTGQKNGVSGACIHVDENVYIQYALNYFLFVF